MILSLLFAASALATSDLCTACHNTGASLVAGGKATYDPICLEQGGLGCISSQNNLNGCRFCEFGEYASVPCNNNACPNAGLASFSPTFPATEPSSDMQILSQQCAAKAKDNEKVTFDVDCLIHGGIGCLSEGGAHNGCRYCEFGPYAQVSCAPDFDDDGDVDDQDPYNVDAEEEVNLPQDQLLQRIQTHRSAQLGWGHGAAGMAQQHFAGATSMPQRLQGFQVTAGMISRPQFQSALQQWSQGAAPQQFHAPMHGRHLLSSGGYGRGGYGRGGYGRGGYGRGGYGRGFGRGWGGYGRGRWGGYGRRGGYGRGRYWG